jgi:hypothetical protein
MSPHGDYRQEMSDPLALDDAHTEALLAGRVVAARQDLAPVSSFIAEMRACAALSPPAPSPALAALLRDGTAAEAARGAQPAPARRRARASRPGWRQRLAIAGLGLSVAATGTVGASAAGLLPDAVQRVVTGVVETLTPLDMPAEGRPSEKSHPTNPVGGVGGQEPGDGAIPGGGPGGQSGASPGTPSAPGGGSPAGVTGGGPGAPGGSSGPGGGGAGAPGPTPPTVGGNPIPPVSPTLPAAPPLTTPPLPGVPTVPPAPSGPQPPPTTIPSLRR